jgi:hypothetical protein
MNTMGLQKVMIVFRSHQTSVRDDFIGNENIGLRRKQDFRKWVQSMIEAVEQTYKLIIDSPSKTSEKY